MSKKGSRILREFVPQTEIMLPSDLFTLAIEIPRACHINPAVITIYDIAATASCNFQFISLKTDFFSAEWQRVWTIVFVADALDKPSAFRLELLSDDKHTTYESKQYRYFNANSHSSISFGLGA